jgi:serine/threonine protein kinase
MNSDYEPLEVIGRGAFGLIRKVRRLSDNKVLVRKEIDYRRMTTDEKRQLCSEGTCFIVSHVMLNACAISKVSHV